jgi:radical SAM-linked protein
MKYIANFTKKDRMVYISHLDLQHMLLRVLRMVGLKPSYSHGFHPHAKLSIALPLSLGYSSEDEYFEIEMDGTIANLTEATTRLDTALPDGIHIISMFAKPDNVKSSLSALATGVTYEIMAMYKPPEDGGALDKDTLRDTTSKWTQADRIEIEKYSKKKQATETVDIKASLRNFAPAQMWGNKVIFELSLSAENGNVQNPVKVFEAFVRHANLESTLTILSVKRTLIEIPNLK